MEPRVELVGKVGKNILLLKHIGLCKVTKKKKSNNTLL